MVGLSKSHIIKGDIKMKIQKIALIMLSTCLVILGASGCFFQGMRGYSICLCWGKRTPAFPMPSGRYRTKHSSSELPDKLSGLQGYKANVDDDFAADDGGTPGFKLKQSLLKGEV
jgi:hypothetical protein